MKAGLIIIGALMTTNAVVLEKGHKLKMKVKARGDDDPPPDVPGGLSDDRFTSHWRKPWPQGHDDGAGDGELLDQFNKPEKKKEKKKSGDEKYPWEYDKDVIDTGKSIAKGEEIKKDTLSYDSVATYKGKNWIFDFKDGKHTKEVPKQGVAGWDYDTEYTGDWKKKGYVDNYH